MMLPDLWPNLEQNHHKYLWWFGCVVKTATSICGDLNMWWKPPQIFVVIWTCGENRHRNQPLWWKSPHMLFSVAISKQSILTLLQNGFCGHKVAAQTHVIYSTAIRLYSTIIHTLPRRCGGCPTGFHIRTKGTLFTKWPLKQQILHPNLRYFGP